MPGPFRILLLARDSVDRETAAELLGTTGGDVRVTATNDALAFATAFADGAIDLAVVADDLEWADALDLFATLRERQPDLPVLLWTDPADFDGTVAAFRAGCADVVARATGSGIALRDSVVRVRTRTVSKPSGEQPLWALVDAAGAAAFRCAHDGTLLARGPALSRLAGDAAARPGANLLAELMPAERLAGLLNELARGGTVVRTGLSADPEQGPWTDLAAVQREDEIWGVLVDRSEVHLLGREVERLRAAAAASAEDVAVGLAHDLREPLRSLGIRLDAVEADLPESAASASREAIDAARGHIARLDEQIRTRLSGGALSGGAPPPKKTPDDPFAAEKTETIGHTSADCNTVFEQVRTNLAAAIAETAGIVTNDPLPTVSVPPAQMLQVLQNLVGNALRHHGEAAPVVHVAARKAEGDWVFSVRDNGPGIPEQHREEAFRTRWRGPGSSGTGVGLAVCRTIVTGQGGRIWIEDIDEGGMAVCFSLPAADEARSSAESFSKSKVSLKVLPNP